MFRVYSSRVRVYEGLPVLWVLLRVFVFFMDKNDSFSSKYSRLPLICLVLKLRVRIKF